MKIKTQLTLAAVITTGLLASGCSQQMVGQQAAEAAAPVVQEPIVKTVVDCSKCAKPTPRPRPSAKKCWHGRNAKGQCNPDPRKRVAPRRVAPVQAPVVVPRVAPTRVVQQPRPVMKRCWHGRNAKGQCNPRPRMSVATRQSQRCWHGRNAQGQCNPGPNRVQHRAMPAPDYQRMATPKAQPNYQQMATPKIQPKGDFRGAIKIDGVMQQYRN